MKLRSFFIILAISVLILLSGAISSLYWILGQSPLELVSGGIFKEPITAVFVPKQAPFMVSLLVNPDRLESLAQYIAFPHNRRRSHREFLSIEKQLLSKTGLDYQTQIRPWLGEEITLAVTSLDFDHNPGNGIQPGYLLAVTTKDKESAKVFLQSSYSKEIISGTSDLIFESYKGVNLIYQRHHDSSVNARFSATAILDNLVLFANDPKILRDAINNVQVKTSNLRNYPNYQKALKTITEPHIGIIYANFPALSAWFGNLPIPEIPEITQTLTVAFSVKSEGLVAQTALIGGAEQGEEPPALSQPVGALAYIPVNSILTAAGTDLNQLWNQIETGLAKESPLQQLLNRILISVQDHLGLNLSERVFPSIQGEFSLAIIPNVDNSELDAIFVAKKIPDINFSGWVDNFDQLAQKRGYSVGKLPLRDNTVTVWTELSTITRNNGNLTSLDARVSGVHTDVDDYVVFATSVDAMSQALSTSQISLIRSNKLQQAVEALNPENDGYFYLDWSQGKKILEQKFPIIKVLELSIKPLLDNVQSLTVSSQGKENGVRRATIFLNVGVP
ncbi:DUF3352 domain-containing protein [Cyanobacterium sp. uoEpiScrs1]|uniref:DUF3352 domain-containing protein n=1 Tax=Cyanobacterium sp. uoEpiScrs1 TaxID=2976343 RepID=UPI00226A1B5C|nr:DUF3352 domain-containing protein [Cyanobacterium sp. uoEpiScrs1]